MKLLIGKILILFLIFVVCNYCIWVVVYPCMDKRSWDRNVYYVVGSIVSLLLFQPHCYLLNTIKPIQNKSRKRFLSILYGLFTLVTIVIWIFIYFLRVAG